MKCFESSSVRAYTVSLVARVRRVIDVTSVRGDPNANGEGQSVLHSSMMMRIHLTGNRTVWRCKKISYQTGATRDKRNMRYARTESVARSKRTKRNFTGRSINLRISSIINAPPLSLGGRDFLGFCKAAPASFCKAANPRDRSLGKTLGHSAAVSPRDKSQGDYSET